MARAAKKIATVIYRHTKHADWGMGMIVEENANKVYLAFEDGGRRPFLNEQKYRDFLVAEAMEPDAIEEVVAKITKAAPKPISAKTAAAKKSKKKAAAAAEEPEVVPEDGEQPEEHDEDEEAPDDE